MEPAAHQRAKLIKKKENADENAFFYDL